MEIQVSIFVVKGKYVLRIPRPYVRNGKRHFYTRLSATVANLPEAQRLANQLRSQIARGIAPTLATYTMLDIWELYLENRRPQLAITTYRKMCRDIPSLLKRLPSDDPKEIAEYLSKNCSIKVSKLVVRSLKAAYTYAIAQNVVSVNPYAEMVIQGVVKKCKAQPFTRQEMANIIAAFENDTRYQHYTNYIRFLFMTGCRPGEAIALHWEQVLSDYSAIWIEYSYNAEYKLRKTTKTDESRRIPCNTALQQLLRSLDRVDGKPLFTHHITGSYIAGHTFCKAIWRKVVMPLVATGKVEKYRVVYNTRHTWITMMLESGFNIAEVGKLAGSSPRMIQDHYFGTTRELEIPEF